MKKKILTQKKRVIVLVLFTIVLAIGFFCIANLRDGRPEKPEMRRTIGIKSFDEDANEIYLDMDADTANEVNLLEFGYLFFRGDNLGYVLWVDARYDFYEVLEYLENY